jgi:hypothetical protein
VPARLIELQDGRGARRDRPGDFGQVQGHGGGVAARQDKAGGAPLDWADGAKDPGRASALMVRRRGPRAAPCPAPR